MPRAGARDRLIRSREPRAESREPTGCVLPRLSAGGARRSSLWRRLRPRENAATLLRGARAAALALAALAVLAVGLPAAAQDAVLVSNTGQGGDDLTSGVSDRAQAFTTGSNSGGYTLSSVEIISEDVQGDDASVSVCTVDGSGYPTTTCTALTAPSAFAAGTLTFTVSPGMTLAITTTYSVLIGTPGGETLTLDSTTSDGEDTGAAAGWSLADSYHFKNSANAWATTSSGESLRITIKGTLGTTTPTNTAPTSMDEYIEADEDTDYTFSSDDFPFTDTAGDSLASVKIVTLPASGTGTLTLSGTTLGSGDLPQTVLVANLGNLKYSPAANLYGTDVASFTFKVNDGTVDSDNAYTMNIDVKGEDDPATGKPGITGTAQVGQTLTATAGTIADLDGLPDPLISHSLTTIQWIQVDGATETDISGATNETYTLATADAGKKIKVKVSFEDEDDTAEGPLTSDAYPASGTVTAAPAQAQTEVWTATLTPGDLNLSILGCSNGIDTARCSSTTVLSDDSFNYDSTDYTITKLFVRSGGNFELDFDADITTATAALTLVVGSTSLVLADADTITTRERIWHSSGVSLTEGTDITVKLIAASTNTAPTAANNTVTTAAGTAYAFSADDFGFADTDTGDTLASVKIVTTPAAGTLALDGAAVMADDVVTKADIDDGDLTFTPVAGASSTAGYASFTFKVNDGMDDSASAYTMTIDVAVLPAITIAADRDKATGKLDWIHYTLNREGDTAAELTVTVTFAGPAGNDWSLDPAGSASQEVTFAAGSAMAEQSIRLTGDGPGQIGFSLSATTSGALTARLGATTGYDTSDTDEVEVVVTSGPAWVIKLAEDHYRFDEDGGDQDIELVATATSADMPAPSLDPSDNSVLFVSIITQQGTAAAHAEDNPGDFLAFSATPYFTSSTCSADPNASNVQVCRSNVTFTPVDDAEAEPDETLELVLAGGLGAPPSIHFQGPGPDRTVSLSDKTYTVTIVDDEFGVTGVTVTSTPRLATDTYGAREHIELSVSFNKPVTVTGAPTFTFDLGGTTTTAAYQGGSGTRTLVFSHQVMPDDADSNGIAWAANALAGGTIVETGGTAAPTLTVAVQSALSDHKVNGALTAPPAITIAADRSTATAKMDWIRYTLNREGDTAAELTVTVTFAGPAGNDWSLDPAGSASQEVTFAADSATAEQSILLSGSLSGIGFSLSATTSGALTARLGATTGYDTSDTDEVAVVVTSGPAWVIKLAEDAYSFDEDGGAQDIELVATAASADMPAPSLDLSDNSVLVLSVNTIAGTAEAHAVDDPGDYLSVSAAHYFPSSTCNADAGNVQVCRLNVTFTPVDDGEEEPDETLELSLSQGLGASPAIHFQGPGPERTVSFSEKTYPITIVDNDFRVMGAATISGAPQVAQTLTAVTTGIRDPDGLTTANYMYQWIRVDGGTEADISGANSSTYTLLAADLGKTIKVRVTFSDDASNAETRTSVATATVIAASPSTCGVPDFGSRRNIWTGALTVEAYRVSGVLVAHGFESIVSVGALAPTTFHIGLNGYTVDGVGVPAGGTLDGDLQFGLTSDLTAAEVAALRLHVCDTAYDFSAANHVASDSTYTWADDLDWSGETTLTLYLSLPAELPAITIAADRPTATGKLDWIHYTLNREGDTAAELTVTVTFAGPAGNDWSLDPAGSASQEVTFAADSATAEQSILLSGSLSGIGFSLSATTSGALTARLGATTGYDTSDTDEVAVVVTSGPAWVIKLAEDAYSFDEDGGAQDIELVATAASADMPAPSLDLSDNSVLVLSVNTIAGTAEAHAVDDPGDYLSVSAAHYFPSSTCNADAGNVQVCRLNVTFTPVDDGEEEPDETLELSLSQGLGAPPAIHFQGPGPDRTVSAFGEDLPHHHRRQRLQSDGGGDDLWRAAGGPDADGGHHRHQGSRRADHRQLHVPVDPGGRRHGGRHFGREFEHLHPARRRPGQDHQGAGDLLRRRQQCRDAHQRGDGDGDRGPAGHLRGARLRVAAQYLDRRADGGGLSR